MALAWMGVTDSAAKAALLLDADKSEVKAKRDTTAAGAGSAGVAASPIAADGATSWGVIAIVAVVVVDPASAATRRRRSGRRPPTSDILSTLASTLAKQGAPMLGGLIGTAIGGLAGKAIESLADAFGMPATPEPVRTAARTRPDAPAVIATLEAQAPALIKLWEIEAQRGTDAQAAEIDKGFGSW